MRISDWSSDVCSSDLRTLGALRRKPGLKEIFDPYRFGGGRAVRFKACGVEARRTEEEGGIARKADALPWYADALVELSVDVLRSEEHTSELQSLMRISYAVFCLHKKKAYTSYHNSTL